MLIPLKRKTRGGDRGVRNMADPAGAPTGTTATGATAAPWATGTRRDTASTWLICIPREEAIQSFSYSFIHFPLTRDRWGFEFITCCQFRPPNGTSRRPLASLGLSERFGWRGRPPASPSSFTSTRTTLRRRLRWPTGPIFNPGTYLDIVRTDLNLDIES